MLYGTGPRLASLSIKTLLGVHSLAYHYNIPGLMKEMVEKIKEAKIPLPEIPSYISFAATRSSMEGLWDHERREAVDASIERTLKSIPGKVRIIRTHLDLSSLKDQLSKILPIGTNLDELLDAYKKFLALKVLCGDTSVPQKFSPSPLVDQVWHAHLMRPRLYRAACAALMGPRGGGDLIDHDPDAAQDDPDEKKERLRRTKVVYHILFGHVAPYKIWQTITSGEMSLFVRTMTGQAFNLFVDPNETVEYLKLRIEDRDYIPSNDQRLIFAGKQLVDSRTLFDYNIQKDSTIHLIIKLRAC